MRETSVLGWRKITRWGEGIVVGGDEGIPVAAAAGIDVV